MRLPICLGCLSQHCQHVAAEPAQPDILSPLEQDIIVELAGDWPQKTSAHRMGLSAVAFRAHLHRIYAKLKAMPPGARAKTIAWAEEHADLFAVAA